MSLLVHPVKQKNIRFAFATPGFDNACQGSSKPHRTKEIPREELMRNQGGTNGRQPPNSKATRKATPGSPRLTQATLARSHFTPKAFKDQLQGIMSDPDRPQTDSDTPKNTQTHPDKLKQTQTNSGRPGQTKRDPDKLRQTNTYPDHPR